MNPKQQLEFASHYLSISGNDRQTAVLDYAKARLAEHEKAAEENAKAGITDADVRKMYNEWAANRESSKTHQEVSAFVQKKIDLAVWPRLLWAGAFFNVETLGEGDLPQFITENNNDFQIEAIEIGEDGGDRQWHQIEAMSQAFYQMKYYSSGLKYYPLWNINTGRKDYFSDALQKVTFGLAYKIDKVAKAILNELVCASGLKAKIASFHSDIEVATLPDKNYLDLSAGTYGTTGVFTLAKWKEILKHVESFNGDVMPSGNPLRLRSVICHPDRMRDSRDFVSLVAGYGHATAEKDPLNTIPPEARSEIWKNGTLSGMFGHNFSFVTTRTVAVNEAWLNFTEVPGVIFQKPTFDQTVRDTRPEMILQNKEGVGLRSCKRLVGLTHLSHLLAKVNL